MPAQIPALNALAALARSLAPALAAALWAVILLWPGKASAATAMVCWYDGETETAMAVEAKSKFYLGDYVQILYGDSSATASMEKASYSSSDKKIATVNGKGYLNARKAGAAVITVKCQGKTLLCNLTVEKKGEFGEDKAVTNLREAAKALGKKLPKKLNASKGFALWNKAVQYEVAYEAYSLRELTYEGFLFKNVRPHPDTVDDSRSEKLAVPEAGRYLTVELMLRQYMQKNNPASALSKNAMQVSSATASGKSGTIKIKLKKKLNADQILGAKLAFADRNSVEDGKSEANITMTVYDETAGIYYRGELVLAKGKKQLSVKIYNKNAGSYSPVDLVKGHVYMLEAASSWAGGTKVTAK